jgi:hypothetical protein
MIEVPEPPHIHRAHESAAEKSKHWLDRVLPLAVIAVSLGSLFVSLHTGRTMEGMVEQNERMVRATSTPILTYDHGNSGPNREPQLNFSIANNGTGPARVVWVEMSYKNKKYPHFFALLQDLQPNLTLKQLEQENFFGQNALTTDQVAPGIMAAKDDAHLLSWTYPKTPMSSKAWEVLDRNRWGIKMEACYCSIFDECWQSTMTGDKPTKVAICKPEGRVNLQG